MTLGIVGYGHAGKLLAKKARAFGMNILVYDPYSTFYDKPDFVNVVSWDELITKSDVISVHCVLTPQTRNMFSEAQFRKMKDGAYFINTSRGEIVDEDALVSALKKRKLAGAAIDVTRKEPISADSILIEAPNLLITPHIAGSSYDVQFCGTNMVIDSLQKFIKGEKPSNCVVYR
jgi:D-3-phosphoglycerate dehydrogenase